MRRSSWPGYRDHRRVGPQGEVLVLLHVGAQSAFVGRERRLGPVVADEFTGQHVGAGDGDARALPGQERRCVGGVADQAHPTRAPAVHPDLADGVEVDVLGAGQHVDDLAGAPTVPGKGAAHRGEDRVGVVPVDGAGRGVDEGQEGAGRAAVGGPLDHRGAARMGVHESRSRREHLAGRSQIAAYGPRCRTNWDSSPKVRRRTLEWMPSAPTTTSTVWGGRCRKVTSTPRLVWVRLSIESSKT